MLNNILLISFYVIVTIQLSYYLGIFSFFTRAKPVIKKNNNKPVSVIICAKNEENNLKNLIPKLVEQVYPTFEIVLINDNATDNTLEIIKKFAKVYPNIKVVDVKENEQFWGNKKYALTLGIKVASYENLLFTDADCQPNSVNWIASMNNQFSDNKQIILGYGAYKKGSSLLNKLIRYETLLTAIQYFGFAKIGLPYMGVGRNLAYTKSLFFKANGFVNHIKIKSGDDDLFVNQVANKKNTAICFNPDSFTTSIPKTNYKDWIYQKRRHITTAKYYKPLHKFLLGLFYTSQLLFWILTVILVITTLKPAIVILLIGVRILIFYLILNAAAKKLQEKDLVFFGLFFEILLILMQLRIFIGNKFSKLTHW